MKIKIIKEYDVRRRMSKQTLTRDFNEFFGLNYSKKHCSNFSLYRANTRLGVLEVILQPNGMVDMMVKDKKATCVSRRYLRDFFSHFAVKKEA